MVYEGISKGAATRAFQADIQRLGSFGYVPVAATEHWEKAKRSTGANVGSSFAIGAVLGALGIGVLFAGLAGAVAGALPSPMTLTVVYRRSDMTNDEALSSKGSGLSWSDK